MCAEVRRFRPEKNRKVEDPGYGGPLNGLNYRVDLEVSE